MTKPNRFTEIEKDLIIRDYQKPLKLKTVAGLWLTSPRTVGRILEERGLATPVPRLQNEARAVMRVLTKYGIDGAIGLETRLNQTMLSIENIQIFLNQCNKKQLASLFYTSGLVKLTEIAKQINDNKQKASTETIV